MRVGIGYDVHRFAPKRALVLGGVSIPNDRGLDGHSDADVLVHAIMDALLGAAGLPDIGTHFPTNDPKYEDASSIGLLKQVGRLLSDRNMSIGNIDATLIAERPKIVPYVSQMKSTIAGALGIEPDCVGIKATTNEGLGFLGRGEGIAAIAVASTGIRGETK